MKRHPALAPLSRDHHHALVIAKRLREATPQTMIETARAFLEHWEAEEKLHFRIEEELLLPAYAAHGDPDHPAVVRVLVDHMLIRRDAQRLAVGAPLQTLRDLGERLADHVSLEEHQLFPLIEATLAESDLKTLGDRICGCIGGEGNPMVR
ncbi:MAG TPA: hemerythrin domain-containing protein [Solirubrobacteraceae bacterium]|nr:hemerythrin domain-containing protein [Solirubrobacteraceae bacterium]